MLPSGPVPFVAFLGRCTSVCDRGYDVGFPTSVDILKKEAVLIFYLQLEVRQLQCCMSILIFVFSLVTFVSSITVLGTVVPF